MQATSKIPVFLADKDCFIDNLTYKIKASFSIRPPGAPDIVFTKALKSNSEFRKDTSRYRTVRTNWDLSPLDVLSAVHHTPAG